MTDTSVDSTADQSKQAASDVADHAKDKAGAVKGTAKSEAKSVVADARGQASDVVGTARDELRSQATVQAKNVSSTLGDLGRQLGDLADGNSESDTQMAQLARSAADSLSQRAERLDEGGFDGFVDDLKGFARNRPGAFLLGTAAAGFAIGRLAKHADLKQAGEHAKGEIDTDQLKPGDSNESSSAISSSSTSSSDSWKSDTSKSTGASVSRDDVSATAGRAAPTTPMAPTSRPPTGRPASGGGKPS